MSESIYKIALRGEPSSQEGDDRLARGAVLPVVNQLARVALKLF